MRGRGRGRGRGRVAPPGWPEHGPGPRRVHAGRVVLVWVWLGL